MEMPDNGQSRIQSQHKDKHIFHFLEFLRKTPRRSLFCMELAGVSSF